MAPVDTKTGTIQTDRDKLSPPQKNIRTARSGLLPNFLTDPILLARNPLLCQGKFPSGIPLYKELGPRYNNGKEVIT